MTDPSMRSLTTVAWGVLLVFADFRINGIDLIPDPVGWVLVAVGAWSLGRTAETVFPAARPGFVVAAAAGVAALLPSLPDWAGVTYPLLDTVASLALPVVMFATCTALMTVLPARRSTANAIRWAAVATSVAVLVSALAANAEPLLVPLALLSVVAALAVVIWFLVLLFGASKDPLPQAA